MDELISSPKPKAGAKTTLAADSVVIGVVVGFDNNDVPLVSFPGCPFVTGTSARTTVAFVKSDIGKNVALLFESGDTAKPVIIGKIHVPSDASQAITDLQPHEALIDGERIVFSAKQEIILQCGKASITLTKAGKIVIRGAYLLNRSSGVNKIKGGSVQIN